MNKQEIFVNQLMTDVDHDAEKYMRRSRLLVVEAEMLLFETHAFALAQHAFHEGQLSVPAIESVEQLDK